MFEPLIHRILVKPEKYEEFDEAHQKAKELNLVIPELEETKRAQASVDRGVVVKIGPTAFRDYGIECPLKVGDIVNYARFSGKYLEDKQTKETFILLNDEDILTIIS